MYLHYNKIKYRKDSKMGVHAAASEGKSTSEYHY